MPAHIQQLIYLSHDRSGSGEEAISSSISSQSGGSSFSNSSSIASISSRTLLRSVLFFFFFSTQPSILGRRTIRANDHKFRHVDMYQCSWELRFQSIQPFVMRRPGLPWSPIYFKVAYDHDTVYSLATLSFLVAGVFLHSLS